jgi:hypothetical protein
VTAPNQPYPEWMQLIGMGAYQLGGHGGGDGTTSTASYGQDVTQDFVTSLVQGPAKDLLSLGGVATTIADVVTQVSTFLSSMPVQGLQMFQGFIPGTTADDFQDIPTSVQTILDALNLGDLQMRVSDFTRWLTDTYNNFAADGAAFWAFVNAVNTALTGYSDWSTFIAAVDAAWDTYQDTVSAISDAEKTSFSNMLLNVFGIDVSGPNAWVAALTTDTQILLDVFHTTYQVGTSTDAPGTLGTNGKPTWYSAWNDLLARIGLSGVTAPTIGPAITSAQSSATTANTNAGTAQTTANTGLSWGQRLTNDLTTLLDVFHVTYTVTQWNAAWADLLVLFGIVNSTSTPSNPAPTIGSAITSAQASATTANTNAGTAQTTANTGNTNTGTFLQYSRILSDVLHLVYPAGSPSDTPTTTIGGLPTWYSAWNGLLQLEGLVKATTAPTQTAPTTGTVIQANTATANTASTNAATAIANASAVATTAQQITDGIYQSQNGGTSTGNPTTSIVPSLTAIPASNIVGQTGAAVAFGASGGNTLSSSPVSWTHTIAVGDLGVLVSVGYKNGGSTVPTFTATYGGVAMTLVVQQENGTGTFNAPGCAVFWLKSPPSGSKTVVVTRTAGSTGSLWVSSDSYSASKIGTVLPTTGGGSNTLSMPVTSQTGRMLFAVFIANNALDTSSAITAFNQTQRYGFATFAAGDALGASSLTFTATMNATHIANTVWSGVIVELTN